MSEHGGTHAKVRLSLDSQFKAAVAFSLKGQLLLCSSFQREVEVRGPQPGLQGVLRPVLALMHCYSESSNLVPVLQGHT